MSKPALACFVLVAWLYPRVIRGPERASGFEGIWHGTLSSFSDLPLLLILEKSGDRYVCKVIDVDRGNVAPATSVRVNGESIHFEIKKIKYDGKISSDSTLTGTWTQDGSFPLVFTRENKTVGVVANTERPIAVTIPAAPSAFRGGGKTHLVYELRIKNSGAADANVKEIEVLGNGLHASLAGRDLSSRMSTIHIPSGASGVAFMWVTLFDSSVIPGKIRHKVVFDNETFEGADIAVATEPVPVLGPPLRGEGWFAGNGPTNQSVHRRALIPFGETLRIAQRFAIDWVQIVPNNNTHSGDSKDNKNYHAYGTEVLAVADGVVATTRDGIPQNIPGENSRAVPITMETVGGNHIILDISQGRYAVYAHLQPGSLRVKVGDRVKRGQVLGLVGNSGNSTEPHLHFQVVDRNSLLESEGVPYVLESFEVRGKDKKYEKREKQLPMDREIIRFN